MEIRANSAILSGANVVLLDIILVSITSALLRAATRQRMVRDIYDRRIKLEVKNSGLLLSPLQYPVRNSWTIGTSLACICAIVLAIVAGFGLEGVTVETYLEKSVWAYAKNEAILDFNQTHFRTASDVTPAGLAAIVTPECLRRSPGRLEFISPYREMAFVGQPYHATLDVAGIECGSNVNLREELILRSTPNDFVGVSANCNIGINRGGKPLEVVEGPIGNVTNAEMQMHQGDCPGNITIQCMDGRLVGCAGYMKSDNQHLIFAGSMNADQLLGNQPVQSSQFASTLISEKEYGNLLLRKMVAMHYALGHARAASHLVALSYGSYRQVSVQVVTGKENVTNVQTIWLVCTALLLAMMCASLIFWIAGIRFFVGRKGYITGVDSTDLASILINESLKTGTCKYNRASGSTGTPRMWLGVEREVPHFGISQDRTAGDWEEAVIRSRN